MERMNTADTVTLAGGVLTVIGAANLNKRWGGFVFFIGKAADLLDGPLARWLHLASKAGGDFDRRTDRLGEASVVAGLCHEGIVPPALPVAGYALSVAHHRLKPPSAIGAVSAVCKDIAIGAGVLATMADRDKQAYQTLKTAAQSAGWLAVGLGAVSFAQVPKSS